MSTIDNDYYNSLKRPFTDKDLQEWPDLLDGKPPVQIAPQPIPKSPEEDVRLRCAVDLMKTAYELNISLEQMQKYVAIAKMIAHANS